MNESKDNHIDYDTPETRALEEKFREIELRPQIAELLNRFSAENGSDTPDFILAQYLTDCLKAFDHAVNAREIWYGRQPKAMVGGSGKDPEPEVEDVETDLDRAKKTVEKMTREQLEAYIRVHCIPLPLDYSLGAYRKAVWEHIEYGMTKGGY